MKNSDQEELIELILDRKGGKTTVKIIDEILKNPNNKNKLAKNLNMDYNTIFYHINIICDLKFIHRKSDKYGARYYPSKKLKDNIDYYEFLKKKLI